MAETQDPLLAAVTSRNAMQLACILRSDSELRAFFDAALHDASDPSLADVDSIRIAFVERLSEWRAEMDQSCHLRKVLKQAIKAAEAFRTTDAADTIAAAFAESDEEKSSDLHQNVLQFVNTLQTVASKGIKPFMAAGGLTMLSSVYSNSSRYLSQISDINRALTVHKSLVDAPSASFSCPALHDLLVAVVKKCGSKHVVASDAGPLVALYRDAAALHLQAHSSIKGQQSAPASLLRCCSLLYKSISKAGTSDLKSAGFASRLALLRFTLRSLISSLQYSSESVLTWNKQLPLSDAISSADLEILDEIYASQVDSAAWESICHDAYRLNVLTTSRVDKAIVNAGKIWDALSAAQATASAAATELSDSSESAEQSSVGARPSALSNQTSSADRFLCIWSPLIGLSPCRERMCRFLQQHTAESNSSSSSFKHVATVISTLISDAQSAIETLTASTALPSSRQLRQLIDIISIFQYFLSVLPLPSQSNRDSLRHTDFSIEWQPLLLLLKPVVSRAFPQWLKAWRSPTLHSDDKPADDMHTLLATMLQFCNSVVDRLQLHRLPLKSVSSLLNSSNPSKLHEFAVTLNSDGVSLTSLLREWVPLGTAAQQSCVAYAISSSRSAVNAWQQHVNALLVDSCAVPLHAPSVAVNSVPIFNFQLPRSSRVVCDDLIGGSARLSVYLLRLHQVNLNGNQSADSEQLLRWWRVACDILSASNMNVLTNQLVAADVTVLIRVFERLAAHSSYNSAITSAPAIRTLCRVLFDSIQSNSDLILTSQKPLVGTVLRSAAVGLQNSADVFVSTIESIQDAKSVPAALKMWMTANGNSVQMMSSVLIVCLKSLISHGGFWRKKGLGSNETLSAAQAVQSVLYTLSHLVQCESEVESLSQSANSLGIVSALSRDEDLLIALVDYLNHQTYRTKNELKFNRPASDGPIDIVATQFAVFLLRSAFLHVSPAVVHGVCSRGLLPLLCTLLRTEDQVIEGRKRSFIEHQAEQNDEIESDPEPEEGFEENVTEREALRSRAQRRGEPLSDDESSGSSEDDLSSDTSSDRSECGDSDVDNESDQEMMEADSDSDVSDASSQSSDDDNQYSHLCELIKTDAATMLNIIFDRALVRLSTAAALPAARFKELTVVAAEHSKKRAKLNNQQSSARQSMTLLHLPPICLSNALSFLDGNSQIKALSACSSIASLASTPHSPHNLPTGAPTLSIRASLIAWKVPSIVTTDIVQVDHSDEGIASVPLLNQHTRLLCKLLPVTDDISPAMACLEKCIERLGEDPDESELRSSIRSLSQRLTAVQASKVIRKLASVAQTFAAPRAAASESRGRLKRVIVMDDE